MAGATRLLSSLIDVVVILGVAGVVVDVVVKLDVAGATFWLSSLMLLLF